MSLLLKASDKSCTEPAVYKFLFVCFCIIFGTARLSAQQNIFNVPSSEITRPKKIFIQQQMNFNNIIQANTTFDYGLKRNMEIGLNLIGLDYAETNKTFIKNDSTDIDPFNPLLLFNSQKLFVLHERFRIAIGTQNGSNFTVAGHPKFATFTYLNSASYFLDNRIRTNLGIYAGNKHYVGKGNNIGLMLGAEAKIIPEKFHFVGDCIVGNNAISTAVMGFVFYPVKALPVSLGWQFPLNPHNKKALVIEITFIQF